MALPRPRPASSSSLPFSLHLTLLSHALASYYTSTSPSLFGNQPYPSFPRYREDDSDDEGGEMDDAVIEGGRSLRDRARQLMEFARWWLDVKQARSTDIMQRRVCAMVDSFTSHGLILLLHSLSLYQLPLLLPTLLLPLPLAFIPYNRSSSLPLQLKTHPQPLRRRTLLLQLLFQLPPLLILSLFLSEIQRTTVLYILQLLLSRSSSSNRRSSLPRLLLQGTPLPLPPPQDASSSVCAICVSPSGGELELFCPSGGHTYHKRCISRWLKVYTRGRREGDGAQEGITVALVREVDDDAEEVQEEEARAFVSSLLRRELGLRVERSQQTQQQHPHHSHPHLFPPPPPLPPHSPNGQPTLLLTSPSPLISTPTTTTTTAASPTFLGTLTTTHPPCPTCRSPLVFQLHLSPPSPPTSSPGPLTTWREFVSGETMLKERGGMQVGALVVVLVMGWLRRGRGREGGV